MGNVPIGNGKQAKASVRVGGFQMHGEEWLFVCVDRVDGSARIEGDATFLYAIGLATNTLVETGIQHVDGVILANVVLPNALRAPHLCRLAARLEVVHDTLNIRIRLGVLVAHETVVRVDHCDGSKADKGDHQDAVAQPEQRESAGRLASCRAIAQRVVPPLLDHALWSDASLGSTTATTRTRPPGRAIRFPRRSALLRVGLSGLLVKLWSGQRFQTRLPLPPGPRLRARLFGTSGLILDAIIGPGLLPLLFDRIRRLHL